MRNVEQSAQKRLQPTANMKQPCITCCACDSAT